MIKVLIVEDEPLVQIGIRSMMPCSELGLELCPVAKDGVQGLEYIKLYQPDIVITDIKMPRMDGLTLMKESKETFGTLPLFLVLTSYEEFKYIKEAMKYDVIDYLIKLELNTLDLTKALEKAIDKFHTLKPTPSSSHNETFSTSLMEQSLYDKYFIKLLYNMFDSKEQERVLFHELSIGNSNDSYVLSYHEIIEYGDHWKSKDNTLLLNLYTSTFQMAKELVKKYNNCHLVSLDTKHFILLYSIPVEYVSNYRELVTEKLDTLVTMIHNYFNVTITSAISDPYHILMDSYQSFQELREIFPTVTKDNPTLFIEDVKENGTSQYIFNMSLFRSSIKSAFEEFNTKVLYETFTDIIMIFQSSSTTFLRGTRYLQSIDAASNILYLAISLLPNGEETVSEIFKDDKEGYRSLYKYGSVEQVTHWLSTLRDGLVRILEEKKKNYKNHTVYSVKKYIDAHICEKLSLPDVANVFGLSPNYLSQLFKKYSEEGFTDYITKSKIQKAKELMARTNMKLYEISEELGFENSFYFSKVFKKVEGISPREYIQEKLAVSKELL